MKICACIAEYNPFHLGHLKHLDYIKTELGAEKLIVIMSGNFTQRGEPAILSKFKRARQAIIAGADAVIELPTVFATANAETFAKGAVNILSDLGIETGLCFGVESGTKEDYISLATALNNESKEFKRALKEHLEKGVSLAKAKFLAVKETGYEFDENLLSSPNNILGVEYTKAILDKNASIEIFPMLRTGNHNDTTFKKGITSASSIRGVLKTGKIKKLKSALPPFVYKELKEYPFAFEKLIMAKVLLTPAEDIAKVPDCTEGLENRIKALSKDNRTLTELIEKVSTKRYTMARVRRILISNLLGITEDLTKEALKSPLYAKVLAINNNSKDVISVLAENSKIPIITRKSDANALKRTAQKCYEIDTIASDVYNLMTNDKENENQTLFV